MSIYACSDIHGQYDLYRKMLEDIHFSDEDTLYVLGDMIDRGPKSMEVILDVMSRKNVIALLGNHELLMYNHLAWKNNAFRDTWLYPQNGGEDNEKAFLALSAQDQERVLDYVKNLPLQIEVQVGGKPFLLSHSFFVLEEGTVYWKDMPDDVVFDTVWCSPWRENEYVPLQFYMSDQHIHVIGHVPVHMIDAWPEELAEDDLPVAWFSPICRVVNIDLGCALLAHPMDDVWRGLCLMDLEAYARGEGKNAFRYYQG